MPTKYLNIKNGIEILHTSGLTQILAGDFDPSVIGLEASIGSLYLCDSDVSTLYTKTGLAATDWTSIEPTASEALGIYYAESLQETSTTSIDYQNKLELGGLPAGTFLIMWCFECSSQSNDINLYTTITANNTINVTEYEVGLKTKNIWSITSGFRRITVPSDDSHINLLYCSSKLGKQVKIKNACFNVWEV